MGLSGPKQKQRLVGSASTRNAAWLNDSSAPGQRMLASMGWSAGQSLGSTMQGLTENLKVAYKMDNKGIGAQRHEREARAQGKDVWVGGGGDLGSLFERLNAANASASSSSTSQAGDSEEPAEEVKIKKKKDKKSDRKAGKEKKDKKGKSKEKEEKDSEKRSKKKRKLSEDGDESIKDSTSLVKDRSKKKKEGKDKSSSQKKEKDRKKSSSKDAVSEAVSTIASADPVLSTESKAVSEIKHDVSQGRPVRLAHRAKFLRAKRMVSANDLASVNEILGIASTPSSSTAGTPMQVESGTSTPTPASRGKTYPGPGGVEIELMDVDRRLKQETANSVNDDDDDAESVPKDNTPSTDKVKSKKRKSSSTKDSTSADTNTKKKKSRKDKKDKESADLSTSEHIDQATSEDQPSSKNTTLKKAEEEAEAAANQIGTNARGLHVFEYLSQRLMLKKAQIARKRKAEQEAIFTRAAAVGA